MFVQFHTDFRNKYYNIQIWQNLIKYSTVTSGFHHHFNFNVLIIGLLGK